jgi:chaperonin GroEL (HSP60 family)
MDDGQIFEELKHELQTTVVTNVFGEEEFKEQFRIVFDTVAKVLANTLGPYGSTTMIDTGTNYAVTKDGFHTLAHIKFADRKQDRIYTTMFNISHQMVAKVGDGSTSAVVAANAFLKAMLDNPNVQSVRPKELSDAMKSIVNELCEIIATNATPVDSNNLIPIVTNIANIATNGNKEFTDMIVGVYKTLGMNCDINIRESATFENSVTYEDGVYSNDNYLVDSLYHNRGNVCHINDCKVLMFDSLLEPEIFDMFSIAFNTFCLNEHSTLIVIAPAYDQFMMDKIRKDCEETVKMFANSATINFRTVFLKSNLTKPIQKYMYRDLAALFGATIMQPPDIREMTKMLNDAAKEASKARAENRQMSKEITDKITAFIADHLGGCDEATMGDRTSAFKGFSNKNEALFNTCYHDAEVKLAEAEEKALNLDTVDDDLFDAKTRFSKINCKSATIEVGGENRLETGWNVDAVDDAVKACASTIKYGYNIGCNMAIIDAIDKHLNEYESESAVRIEILKSLRNAFVDVYRTILANGMSKSDAEDVLNMSLSNKMCYDMATKTFDVSGERVINSCRTDIEILRGAIAMVAIVFTCNQYISTTLNR